MRTTWQHVTVTGALVALVSWGLTLRAQEAPGQSPQRPPLPQPVPISQLEERLPDASQEQTFSLSFAEPIGIRELLMLTVRDTGLSVVLEPGVEGTFVGELKNVTLTQALDLSLRPLNLLYSFEDRVVRVFKPVMETRIFNVNYVATRRFGTRGSGGGGLMGGGGYGTGGGNGYSGGSMGGGSMGYGGAGYGGMNGGGGTGLGGSASVGSQDSTDFFQELETGLRTILSDEAKSNVDRKAGIVQVTDFPDRLDKVALYLEAVQQRVNRQVQIQAKVLEVELNSGHSAGINWSTVFQDAGNSVSLTQELVSSALSGAFTLGVEVRDFTGLLKAFASQGRVNVLSSPRVTAMNNEPAIMRVGTQDVFFVTTSQVDGTTGRILQTTVTPQAITEGIVLSVTPQVSGEGIIQMSISPSITERMGEAVSRLGDTVPIINVRETDTLVRVRDGETIVIAGLMQDKLTRGGSKVPLLGDVPVVGGLFRFDEKTKKKTDLVIMLTPTLMTPAEVAADAARSQERLYEAYKAPVRK
jgi:MSHA biogenesis protein MshL